jgi:hypothetical protein
VSHLASRRVFGVIVLVAGSLAVTACRSETADPRQTTASPAATNVVATVSTIRIVGITAAPGPFIPSTRPEDRSTIRVGGSVKTGQTFEVEFGGLAVRMRGRNYILYEGNARPVAILTSGVDPEVPTWVWWEQGLGTQLTVGAVGFTSKLMLPSPLEPGDYQLCFEQRPFICGAIDVVA